MSLRMSRIASRTRRISNCTCRRSACGWVRLDDNRIEVWRFDDKALETIQQSDYWEGGRRSHWPKYEISEITTGDLFVLPTEKLLNVSAEPGALKYVAQKFGKFRNPKGEPLNETKMVFAWLVMGYPVRSLDIRGDHVVVEMDWGRGRVERLEAPLPEKAWDYRFKDWQSWARVVFN